MNILEKQYNLEETEFEALSFDAYSERLEKEYAALLDNPMLQELDLQSFFERNPCMLPFPSACGFNPVFGCLFSQPRLTDGVSVRVPDFMWLGRNSAELRPLFIEIESPDKAAYRKCDGVQCAVFSQAENQLLEWMQMFEEDQTKKDFYEKFCIPKRLQGLLFRPQFMLIYGRRREVEEDLKLLQKRAQKQKVNFIISTFDRLQPNFNLMRCPSAKEKNGSFELLQIPPSFQLGPAIASNLSVWEKFDEAVDICKEIGDGRKAFLKNRYPYWRKFAERKKIPSSLICTSDWE